MNRKSIAIIACALVVLAVGALITLRTGRKAESTQASKQLEAELVSVREWGFEPTLIKRPSGPFILRVENRSGLQAINVMLMNEDGTVVRKIPLSINLLNWTDRLDLPPGKYSLRQNDESELKCQIQIMSQ
jgi:hypothetical protein